MDLNALILSAGGLILLVTAVLVTYILTRRSMSQSIGRFAETVKEIGAGNLTFLLQSSGAQDRELAALYGALNEMTERLINTVTKLTYSSGNIDKMAGDIFSETESLRNIATEQKDFSDRVALSVDDVESSIREIYESIESLKIATTDSLGGLAELNEDAELITRSVTEFKVLVDASISSVVRMSNYLNEAAKNTNALEGFSRSTVSSVKEIEHSIRAIESNADEAGLITEKVYLDAKEGAQVVEETIAGITESREIVASSTRIIEEVGERSDKISEVIDIINGIADRTKLLALNASIIASQAGEHGKGFAVVADEIAKLSNLTTTSTSEIREIVKGLQGWSGKGIDSMRKGLLSIDESVALAEMAGKTLVRIVESSQKASGATREIVETTKKQARGAAKALETMESIKSMIEKVSHSARKEADTTNDVNALMRDMKDLTDRVMKASEKRTASSVMIAESSEVVGEMLHHITEASRRQHEKGAEIVGGVKKITRSSRINVESSEKLSKLVKPLKELSEMLNEEVAGFRI